MRFPLLCATVALALLSVSVNAEVFFHETFDSMNGWVQSKHSEEYGSVKLSAGANPVDAASQQGLMTVDDARFYAVSKKLPTAVTNKGKELVFSFSLKREKTVSCAGGYLKLLPEMDAEDFHGETPYWLMFGPDHCGPRRVHIIFNYKGKQVSWNMLGDDMVPADRMTHVYTLHVMPNNTFAVYLDGEYGDGGDLEEQFPFLLPANISDPEDTKPEDWDDRRTVPDPDDKKPDDWDDEPPTIPDPDAVRPDDWNDAEDGEWEAPTITNPMYKGQWQPKEIPNPNYKGHFTPRKIPNPEYHPDEFIHATEKPLQYVGIDLWQVESGSIFDNIIIGDNLNEVFDIINATYRVIKAKEVSLVVEEDRKAKAAKEAKDEHLENTDLDDKDEENHPHAENEEAEL